MVNAINIKNIKGIASCLSNVLETVTIKEYPLISEIKTFLTDNGASGSLMSGSGPTVFGIFENKEKASAVYKKAKEKYNNADIILCHTVQPDTPQHDNRA